MSINQANQWWFPLRYTGFHVTGIWVSWGKNIHGIFDLTNNSGYVNASEFKLKPETEEAERKVLTAEELPILGKDGKLHDRSEIEKLSKLKALPKDDNVTEWYVIL